MIEQNNSSAFVSIIMPVYNEEKYISDCIESLFEQTYEREKMEWLIIDGCSTDNTKLIIEKYKKKYPNLIYIYDNPNKTAPFAMNIGISNARGKYIIRLDAHAKYNKDYISKCVYYLDNTDADNVGGIAETRGKGFVGESIALMLSSKFGVGNSQFRTNGKSGYVDTVPFGAFRSELFKKVGMFDVRLSRSEDNELNSRIRKNGGKVYLSTDIKFIYYCRDTIRGIAKMARENGKCTILTTKICPGTMRLRHFIPFIFVMSIVSMLILSTISKLFLYLLALELLLYLSLDIIFSIKCTKNIMKILMLLFLFPTFHISYGIGSLIGLLSIR